MRRVVLATAGAGSGPLQAEAASAACAKAMAALREGQSCLVAAVQGCTVLEDGLRPRGAAEAAELEAACATSDGKFGAVTGLRDVRNPVLVAQAVHATPHNLLAGPGAMGFARALGHLAASSGPAPRPPTPQASNGTVAVLAGEGDRFAAAASAANVGQPAGRVGDVPLIGCALHAGPAGAVAVSGAGERVVALLLARRLQSMLEAGQEPRQVAAQGAQWFGAEPLDVLVLGPGGHAQASTRPTAWAMLDG